MAPQSVSVSKEYLFLSMAISFLVVLIYMHIASLIYCKILRRSGDLTNAKKNRINLLRIATAIWITIIIEQIIHYGVLNMVLISKISECTDGYCMYCDVFGRFNNGLHACKGIFIILFLVQILKNTSILSHYLLIAFVYF